MKFQCSQCGACCRRAGLSGLMPQRDDGACIYLGEDNLCKIYETRPELCRVESMVNFYKEISRKQLFILNSQCCNEFIKEDGLDDKYLIDISRYEEE